jgi:hypothetical protein
MPTVGDLSFPYTKDGYEAAKRASAMLGKPVGDYSEVLPNQDLYSNIGKNLDTVFGKGIDTRGGSRTMKTPGLATPNFNTGATQSGPNKMAWQNQEKELSMEY